MSMTLMPCTPKSRHAARTARSPATHITGCARLSSQRWMDTVLCSVKTPIAASFAIFKLRHHRIFCNRSKRRTIMADIKIFNPTGLAKPPGTYTHIARAKTQEGVFIAGQVPSDTSGATVGKGNFDAQCMQVYANIHAALRSVGADWGNVVQFTS